MSDAAHWILTQVCGVVRVGVWSCSLRWVSCVCFASSLQQVGTSGNFFIDDEVLMNKVGMTEAQIAAYSVTPGLPLMPDAYVGDADAFLKWVKAGDMIASIGSLFGKKK